MDPLYERLVHIELFLKAFKEIEPSLPKYFSRGTVQAMLLKRFSLPRLGHHMRSINEAIELCGHKKVLVNGKYLFKKGALGESRGSNSKARR